MTDKHDISEVDIPTMITYVGCLFAYYIVDYAADEAVGKNYNELSDKQKRDAEYIAKSMLRGDFGLSEIYRDILLTDKCPESVKGKYHKELSNFNIPPCIDGWEMFCYFKKDAIKSFEDLDYWLTHSDFRTMESLYDGFVWLDNWCKNTEFMKYVHNLFDKYNDEIDDWYALYGDNIKPED